MVIVDHGLLDASKPTRNGFGHPMFEVYLIATLSCSQITEVIGRIETREDMSILIKEELIATLKEASPHCLWDANAD